MKNGICPKCGSNEVPGNLRVRRGEGYPTYVNITEPVPEKRPFVWMAKNEQSQFRAYICGVCGDTEFYAENYTTLIEGHKKGYASS